MSTTNRAGAKGRAGPGRAGHGITGQGRVVSEDKKQGRGKGQGSAVQGRADLEQQHEDLKGQQPHQVEGKLQQQQPSSPPVPIKLHTDSHTLIPTVELHAQLLFCSSLMRQGKACIGSSVVPQCVRRLLR